MIDSKLIIKNYSGYKRYSRVVIVLKEAIGVIIITKCDVDLAKVYTLKIRELSPTFTLLIKKITMFFLIHL